MCGICGIVRPFDVKREEIERMTSSSFIGARTDKVFF